MRFVLPSALLVALATAAQPPSTDPPSRSDLDVDFRGGRFRDSVLAYAGPRAKEYITREPGGLHITIPAGADDAVPVQQVGFRSNLNVHGDFEITVSYEIIQAEKPTKGYGLGVALHVIADSPDKDGAVVARRNHPKKGTVYATNRTSKGPDSAVKNNIEMVQATATKGQLRLTRTGSTLTYFAADADNNKGFEKLREVEFADNPLSFVRVTADPGNSLSALDVLIHSFSIHSINALSGGLPSPPSKGGWIWLVVIVGVGLLAAGAFLTRRYLWRPAHKS